MAGKTKISVTAQPSLQRSLSWTRSGSRNPEFPFPLASGNSPGAPSVRPENQPQWPGLAGNGRKWPGKQKFPRLPNRRSSEACPELGRGGGIQSPGSPDVRQPTGRPQRPLGESAPMAGVGRKWPEMAGKTKNFRDCSSRQVCTTGGFRGIATPPLRWTNRPEQKP